MPLISTKYASFFFWHKQEKRIPAAEKPITKLLTPTTTGTHTGIFVGHSGLGVMVVARVGAVALVDSGEDVESGTEDPVLVSVVGGGIGWPTLLTLVKMKGLA